MQNYIRAASLRLLTVLMVLTHVVAKCSGFYYHGTLPITLNKE